MAEIDKALPNEVRKQVNIPSQEEIQVEIEKELSQETKDRTITKNKILNY